MDASASSRRQFLKLLGTAAVIGSVTPDILADSFSTGKTYPGPAWISRTYPGRTKTTSLTILHTNDVHSRLDPFPMDGSRNAGKGGVARRATLIHKIRQEQVDGHLRNVLLFDAGDIFQGTPYFNLYKGEPEILAMSRLGYDAGTIGNHDFDGGIDNMVTQFGKASFPILIANYDFKNTVMDGKTMPHKVFDKEGIRIGVFGLGIKPEGLIPKEAYKETKYLDPVEIGNDTATRLRNDQHCDYVICLSHLGFEYKGPTVSDNVLAAKSRHIDLIIGGHTHTFLDAPVAVNNLDGQAVWINQVGFAGINLGRIDLAFEKGKAVSRTGSSVEV